MRQADEINCGGYDDLKRIDRLWAVSQQERTLVAAALTVLRRK